MFNKKGNSYLKVVEYIVIFQLGDSVGFMNDKNVNKNGKIS